DRTSRLTLLDHVVRDPLQVRLEVPLRVQAKPLTQPLALLHERGTTSPVRTHPRVEDRVLRHPALAPSETLDQVSLLARGGQALLASQFLKVLHRPLSEQFRIRRLDPAGLVSDRRGLSTTTSPASRLDDLLGRGRHLLDPGTHTSGHIRGRVQADVRSHVERAGEEPLPAAREVLLALLLQVRVIQEGRHHAPRLGVPRELASRLSDHLLTDRVPGSVLVLLVELVATDQPTETEQGAQALRSVAEVPGLLVLLHQVDVVAVRRLRVLEHPLGDVLVVRGGRATDPAHSELRHIAEHRDALDALPARLDGVRVLRDDLVHRLPRAVLSPLEPQFATIPADIPALHGQVTDRVGRVLVVVVHRTAEALRVTHR